MDSISGEVGPEAIPKQEPLEHMPKKHVMGPLHTISNMIMHAQTHFEPGAKEELHEHRDSGGGTLLLMSHFRRWEPIVMARISRHEEPLRFLQYNTGITARSELFEMPVIGYIVRNSGSQAVKRAFESPNETPEEKIVRQEENQKTQVAGSKYLANDKHWLIFPEGGSKRYSIEDGVKVKKPRDPDTLLPIQNGFVYTLEGLTGEQKERVKLLGIVVHYGERRFSSLRPTVYVTRPAQPIQGSREEIRQQGQDLMQHGLDEVLRLDKLRC